MSRRAAPKANTAVRKHGGYPIRRRAAPKAHGTAVRSTEVFL